MLALAAAFVPAKAGTTEMVPLWPLYYSTTKPDGSSDVEVLFNVFSRQRSATGGVSGNMVPVFWGTNYFHVIPFYWHWNENYLIIPLAWSVNGNKGIGPVWWGQNYFCIAPLYWRYGANWWLLPLGAKVNESKPGYTHTQDKFVAIRHTL